MRYFNAFVQEDSPYFEQVPQPIDRQQKEVFQYAVGANLYMNGRMDLYKQLKQQAQDVGAVTICFEDAISEADLPACEESVLTLLTRLEEESQMSVLTPDDLPAIFIRVRQLEQFIAWTSRLTVLQSRWLAGFVFPKFTVQNAGGYLHHLDQLRATLNPALYAMPILESRDIIYKETRMETLLTLRRIVAQHPAILNIRVGGTDFSSAYGLRRRLTASIHDLRVVSDCLTDILNVFGRADLNLVVSGPVWEYFSNDFQSPEIQGLLRELALDQENGFHGKTSIHPTQARYINRFYVVEYEEYQDAMAILNAAHQGGVFKGANGNKMNEVAPHLNWAKRIQARATVFGVLKPNVSKDEWLQAPLKK